MNIFYLDTVFTFDKYEGDTLEEIAEFDPSYIEWCIQKLEVFYIDEDTVRRLESTYKHFSISEKARNILDKKKIKINSI